MAAFARGFAPGYCIGDRLPLPHKLASNMGGGWESGTGYIRREGEWEPAKKIVNGKAIASYSSSSPRFFPAVPRVASLGFAGGVSTEAKSFIHEPHASLSVGANIHVFSSQAFEHSGRASCVAETYFTSSTAHAEKIVSVDWLSIDEILIALEEM